MKQTILVCLLGTALTAPAAAQTAQGANPDQGLDDIIVTAQKRAEGLSDVPISISAVSGKLLESYGQTSLEQLSYSVPNLKITQTGIANRIAIRGIASGDNKGFEQSVAMFVDNVYYGRDQLSRLPLVDLERIEVLRGPQPTLFGNNAIAGAVNIVTRRPTAELEASLSGLYEFNHQEAQLTGVISGPVADGIGARLVGYYRHMDGFFRNRQTQRDEPNVREAFVRGIVDFDRGGPARASLKLEYADFRTRGQPREAFGATGTYAAVFTGPLAVDTVEDYVKADGGYVSDNRVLNAVLNTEFDVGEHVLTSVTGYVDYRTRETIDVDFTELALLDGTTQGEDYAQFSQELRLTSPGGEKFDYIAGVYYQHSRLDADDRVRFNRTFLGFGPPFNAIGDTSNARVYAQKSDLFSAFAQGELELGRSLRLTAGARFNHERKSGARTLVINRGPANSFALPVVLGTFRALNIEAHQISGRFRQSWLDPMANLQFDVSDALMVYVSFARGTKAGGFDIRSNSRPDSTTVARPGAFQFDRERANNLEAGLKYKAGALAFNVSLYRTDYDDLQVNIFDGTLNFNVRNAAGARTQGVEADARIAVTDRLTLSGAVAYLDFKFTDFTSGQCFFQQVPGPGGFCDYTGKRNALSPRWSGNANADFRQPLADGLKLGFNLNMDFSSSFIASANLDPRTRQSAFARLGARIALAAEDDRWEIALVGRNLTNQRILQQAGPLPLSTTITRGGGIAYTGIYDRPRNIALAFNLRF